MPVMLFKLDPNSVEQYKKLLFDSTLETLCQCSVTLSDRTERAVGDQIGVADVVSAARASNLCASVTMEDLDEIADDHSIKLRNQELILEKMRGMVKNLSVVMTCKFAIASLLNEVDDESIHSIDGHIDDVHYKTAKVYASKLTKTLLKNASEATEDDDDDENSDDIRSTISTSEDVDGGKSGGESDEDYEEEEEAENEEARQRVKEENGTEESDDDEDEDEDDEDDEDEAEGEAEDQGDDAEADAEIKEEAAELEALVTGCGLKRKHD